MQHTYGQVFILGWIKKKSKAVFAGRFTWQVTSCVIIVSVVLDKWWRRRDIAGLHRGHAGSSSHRRRLAVQV